VFRPGQIRPGIMLGEVVARRHLRVHHREPQLDPGAALDQRGLHDVGRPAGMGDQLGAKFGEQLALERSAIEIAQSMPPAMRSYPAVFHAVSGAFQLRLSYIVYTARVTE
jgi:hypothetical protein